MHQENKENNKTGNAPSTIIPQANITTTVATGILPSPEVQVISPNIVSEDKGLSRVTRYVSRESRVKTDAQNATRTVTVEEKSFLLKTDINIPKKIGLMMVGWGGNNGTTLTASLLAHKHNIEWKTKRGTQRPNWFGSLVMAGTVVLGTEVDPETGVDTEVHVPMHQIAPFIDPTDLVIGGWDLNGANMADAMERAEVLEWDLQDKVRPMMQDMKPLPSIYDPDFIASNQSDRADNLLPNCSTKQQQLDAIRAQIRDFKKVNGLQKVIILWTANTERFCDISAPGLNDSAASLLKSISNNEKEVSPSTIFGVAAALEKCPFINGSPQNTCVNGLVELATQNKTSIGGDDFKSGQTKMKSVLVDFLISSGIKPVSIVSYNHLGNNDGKNLNEQRQFRSKEISKSNVVDDMVASNTMLYRPACKARKLEAETPDHCIVIKYIPAVGDSKRAMDEYESEIFMGGRSTISIHNICEDSLLASPLMLDLVLFIELLDRVQVKRESVVCGAESQEWESLHSVSSLLSFMLKAPLVPSHAPVVNALMRQRKSIDCMLRAMVGLPPVDDLALEHRLNKC